MTREDEYAALAAERGWEFQIEDPFGLGELPLQFLRTGIASSISDVLWGEVHDMDFVAFELSWGYLVGAAAVESASTNDASCALAAIAARCPEIMVSHETLGHWLEHPLHHEVFQAESPEFARAFRVTTTDHAFAGALLHPAMQEWLMRHVAETDLCFEIADTWLLCFTYRRPISQLPSLLDALAGFRQRIPNAVYETHGIQDEASAVGRLRPAD